MSRLFDIYIKFFLLGCTIFYIPGQQFYAPQEIFFQYGVMGMLGICYFVPRKRQVNNLFLGMVFLYALIQTILFHFQPANRMILLNMFLGFLLIREVTERVDLNLKSIGEMLALFCAFNTIWLALQIHNIDPVFSSVSPENMLAVDTVGWMGLKSNLGTLAALSFPFIFYSSPFSAIIVLPLLWFGRSSSAIASVMLTLFFILWFRNKKIFLISLVLAGILGVLYVWKVDMPTGEFQKRFPVWFAGIGVMSGQSRWFGTGLGGWALTKFTTMQDNGQPQTWQWAHNTFIQYFFELGLFGIVTLFLYFKNIFLRISLKIKNHVKALSLLIPLLITSFIHFPWHVARFAGLSCFMVACIEALLIEKEQYEK